MPGSPGSGPVFLQELSCSDNDTHILNCNRYVPSHSLIIIFFWCKFPLFQFHVILMFVSRFTELGLANCDHSRDITVRCRGELSLCV